MTRKDAVLFHCLNNVEQKVTTLTARKIGTMELILICDEKKSKLYFERVYFIDNLRNKVAKPMWTQTTTQLLPERDEFPC